MRSEDTNPPEDNEEMTRAGFTRDGWDTRTSSDDAVRLYLLVFQGQTSTMFHLPMDGQVVIGRGGNADLRLQEDGVSRQHARITLRHGEARLEDLGSRNGTLVNGNRITGQHLLAAGQVIGICNSTLLFYSSVRPQHARRVLLGDEELIWRAEEELDRSLRFQRPLTFAVVLVPPGTEQREIALGLRRSLRNIDLLGQGRPGEIVIVMPETAGAPGLTTAQRLVGGGKLRAGCGACPGDGCDVATLLSSARAAADAAAPGTAVAAATSHRVIQLGGRKVIVADAAMARIFALIERLASADLPVLVCGETGTGKEIAALALHQWSSRASKPMVTLNCAAVQENLVESELFGYERGAFSGAITAKPGLLETADGGTVFLDEIGELSVPIQAKLLRVLEFKRLVRVGGLKEKEVDLRFVAATNRDLKAEVAAGRFRKDLFYRLSGATLWLVPLRDRIKDIPILAESFLAEACERIARPTMAIADESMQRLVTYSWPGNIRELKNVMDYVASTSGGTVLEPDDLAEHLVDGAWSDPDAIVLPPPPPIASTGSPSLAHAVSAPAVSVPPTTPGDAPMFRPLGEEMRELERRRIEQALAAAGGNRTRAAALIQMPLRTLGAKMKQYGLGDRNKEPE